MNISRKLPCILPAIAALFISLPGANAAVIVSNSSSAPVAGPEDPANFTGGASLNAWPQQGSSATNSGFGQTFLTGSNAQGYLLESFSLQGGASFDSAFFTALNQAWSIRVSQISGTTLTPLATFTNIAIGSQSVTAGTDWYTWTFSGTELLTLEANTTYAVQVIANQSWFQFAASSSSVYPDGQVIVSNISNSGGYYFDGTTASTRSYDRVFVANLTAVPEPAAFSLLLGGLGLAFLRRNRGNRA